MTTTSIHYRPHKDPKSSHQQIAALVRELASRGFSPVLDVGAAQGMLGHMLAGSSIEIDAIEPNGAWAEMAQPHYRSVFAKTVEDAPLAPRSYRLVVCGDVLEHVIDPVAVLLELRKASAADAKFVISLPNVAHLAIRAMLLFGRFPQMERGILDRTHLHFYTRDTARDMLDRAGLKIERASVTGVPIDELLRDGDDSALGKMLTRFQHVLLKLLPRVFGYQLIFVASAKDI